jgi:hypothetical protein
MNKPLKPVAHSAIALTLAILYAPSHAQTGPVTGAVFTTGPNCQTVNGNIYNDKASVYLDGGPARAGSAGLLSLTNYYVQVTDPNGNTVLGSSLNNSGNKTPITTDSLGDVIGCFQLQSIVSMSPGVSGFADTPNAGGEYKVWLSTASDFKNSFTKTDNFKVKGSQRPTDTDGSITIRKFYDTNADGKWQQGEPWIEENSTTGTKGWRVDLLGFDYQPTQAVYPGLSVTGGQTYTAREYQPIQTNWYSTTPTPLSTTPSYLNQQTVTLNSGPDANQIVTFGNVCTGVGGGLTIGYWSNKNGMAAMKAKTSVDILAGLRALKLVNAQGKDFDPWQFDQIPTWLLNATAQNMAYMLSAQLAAMYLNVYTSPSTGKRVDPNSMIYAAGTPSANPAGFATVGQVMTDAQNALVESPLTPAGSPYRPKQEAIKNALDMANNNRTFVQSSPCAYDFPAYY